MPEEPLEPAAEANAATSETTSVSDSDPLLPGGSGGHDEVIAPESSAGEEADAEAPAAKPQAEISITLPMGEAGYVSSSFGLTLTSRAAINLAKILAGLQGEGIAVASAGDAINYLLESCEQ